ncbi:YggS family pyridoxal phosphate-dependent enzyme [Oleiagrimonas sp. C23AA]|uniref:YggS family pyridoxal phosphate-dependent enzyme n=1 Tax=Oleiagrimonas sp. C23AA TaxID=2719047 RepID=UPI001423DB27|nr:YggS family pyridoxal phosphate-dependent enzyme [Oleiagrimonas sp. C23AA]NII10066.1 YggS family pyridoxal phosphate-dependent enzyme [Oleiagrimonas sp. C23AA]
MSADAGHDLAARWAAVRERVAAVCQRVGRAPGSVQILPVSKTFPADTVRQAASLGLTRFGENKVQEIREKAAALADLSLEWVVIGHLQTNKAKDVARLAAEVQSLDRLDLAQALQRRLDLEGRQLDVLVQVKTSSEDSKFGLAPQDLPAFLDTLAADYPALRVRGLMTLAEHSDDEAVVRGCFARLRQLREEALARGHALERLSMGMSGDFEWAIAEGSTEVRIGSAIFGARQYQKA